ncbi:MAG TPA: hypothetical protein QF901_10235 [Gammaproteobacteria bacterium]|nr:hypothetical protein [Gammaproteobacteria bacterium]
MPARFLDCSKEPALAANEEGGYGEKIAFAQSLVFFGMDGIDEDDESLLRRDFQPPEYVANGRVGYDVLREGIAIGVGRPKLPECAEKFYSNLHDATGSRCFDFATGTLSIQIPRIWGLGLWARSQAVKV